MLVKLLFFIFSKLVTYFKPVNPFSDEMLKKCNPLELICERYSIQDKYYENIYSNPQHLHGENLYKAIYYVLITDDTFTDIEGNKTVIIEGLTPTQRLTLSLKLDLDYSSSVDLEIFMNIVKEGITLTNYDEHVNCIIIKYKKV